MRSTALLAPLAFAALAAAQQQTALATTILSTQADGSTQTIISLNGGAAYILTDAAQASSVESILSAAQASITAGASSSSSDSRDLGDRITSGADGVWETVTSGADGAWDTVTSAAPSVWSEGTQRVASVWGEATEAIAGIFDGHDNAATGLTASTAHVTGLCAAALAIGAGGLSVFA